MRGRARTYCYISFFFSSRRRHTRFDCDWSSDVCSSDLTFPVDGRGLRLEDLATVAYREPDLDYGRHLDRSRAIGLNVIKESGANTVRVARAARRVLKEMERDPQLAGIQVLTFTDQGDDIENSLRGLLESGVIGALL